MRKIAFTLVELMIVISIIAIVFAIAYPLLLNAKESGRQTACIGNLRQIHVALGLYSADYGNMNATGLATFPRGGTPHLLEAFGLSKAQQICPDSRVLPPSSSYMWPIFALGEYDGIGPDLNPIAESQGSSFHVVVCTTHDAVFYAPREQDIDYVFQKAFSLDLLASGAVLRERGQVPRLPVR